jgi:hypothetical protein
VALPINKPAPVVPSIGSTSVLHPEGIAGLPTASVASTVAGSPPFAAPRLSIVVLPFKNLSDDREQQYFADGITEDLTTDLSRLENMFVISRNTAFTYRTSPSRSRSGASWACAMCSKGASGGRAASSA